ncbi:hypothetical protein BAUCODRAFT_161054 [Baudoinia panamericana UAMH 10762]|uniref:G domain-containing protein n=1 Tax=Baudoinia panamericana (strain UAMH 10762) TaxID=717646 RepID=M2M3B8_BAUPA|nr:uncharacterized protein BAUCODRAFT_161054 [Baudoinia panamericana UAMH 10762]EMC91006.1 hypothetical protein BAUCODRAFT_161054 [Baudoinia panamericana UAMH 10762]
MAHNKRSGSPLFMGEDSDGDSAISSVKRNKIKPDTVPTYSDLPGNSAAGGRVPRYNAINEEGRPNLAIYHPSFAIAEGLVTTVCNDFIDVVKQLKESGYTDPEVESICDKSLKRWREPRHTYPDVGPVAFLGPAGVGKSSALNCILNQEAVAVESDSGTRGTALVHEYKDSKMDQPELYAVDVYYKHTKTVESLVERHCKAIVDLLNMPDEDLADMDAEERVEARQKHDTALNFFTTILCDYDEFASADEARDYFVEQRSEDIADIARHIVSLIAGALEAQGITRNGNVQSFTAQDEAELNVVFQRIAGHSGSTSSGNSNPSLWPLISTVSVHQDKDLLNAGVVLADTPGVTDTNRSVVEATRSYLRRAGTIMVFAQPSRIVQNPDLDANLRECISLGKMEKSFLIVTMIDQKSSLKEAEKQALPVTDKEMLLAAEQKVQKIKQDIVDASQEKNSTKDFQQYRAIDKRLRDLEIEEITAHKKVKQVVIEIRNRNIKRELKDKFRQLSGSKRAPDLKVFCVSHSEYQKHVVGYDIKDPPTLDVTGTGVPAVRRMLYSVPAYGKLNALEKISTTRLPHVFNGICGILSKDRLARKGDVEMVIAKVFESNESVLRGTIDSIKVAFYERILTLFRNNDQKWKEKAVNWLDNWANINGGTFTAFCRRSGHWKVPGNKTKTHWNHEILALFSRQVMSGYNALEDDVEGIQTSTFENVSEIYTRLKSKLEACDAFQGIDEKPFFKYIDEACDIVNANLAKQFKELMVAINQIRFASTLPNEESYTALQMQSTYEECLKVGSTNYAAVNVRNKQGKIRKRNGASAARVETIRRRLTGEGDTISIFAAVAQQALEVLEADLGTYAAKCQNVINSGAGAVQRDFDRRFQMPEAKAEKNEEAVRRLQQAAMEALAVIEGPLKEHLVLAKAYEEEDAYKSA